MADAREDRLGRDCPFAVPIPAALFAASLVLTASDGAAQTRSELISQARTEVVGSQPALDFLLGATDPTASLDSAWAIGVYDIADNLLNIGESDLSATWLRWAARHGRPWPIDRGWYSPVLVDAYDVALSAVDGDGGLQGISTGTSWRWPATFDAAAGGSLEVAANAPQDLTVSVAGQGTTGPGGTLALAAGTYVVTASATGFEEAQVSREVLPGATTVLEFDLPPILSEVAESRARASLARIIFRANGERVCTNGVIADAQGLVLTTLSGIQDAVGIEVATQQGTFGNVSIGATDDAQDVAVLRAGQSVGTALAPAGTFANGQYAWSFYQPGCGEATQVRNRLLERPGQPRGGWDLLTPLPIGARGAPLVDASGDLIGLITGVQTVLPMPEAQALILQARAQTAVADAVAQASSTQGGGPSLGLLAGGLGAAGAAVVAILGAGGGGGSPGGGGGGGPGTGSITINFPGGP